MIDHEDLFFMGAIKKKKPVRLSTFIIQDLRRVIHGEIKSLQWPIIIIRLVQKFRVKEQALEGGNSFFNASTIRIMEWTDVGSHGVWRRKKPEPVKPPIPSLSEQAPPEEVQPEPTKEAAAASPPKAKPIEKPSSSQAAPTKPQEPATLEEIREQLVDLQSLIFDGFTNVHKVLTQQHERLGKMEEQIQGLKFTLGFEDVNIDILLRKQRRAEAEAKKKEEEEQQQREEEAPKKLKKPNVPKVQTSLFNNLTNRLWNEKKKKRKKKKRKRRKKKRRKKKKMKRKRNQAKGLKPRRRRARVVTQLMEENMKQEREFLVLQAQQA